MKTNCSTYKIVFLMLALVSINLTAQEGKKPGDNSGSTGSTGTTTITVSGQHPGHGVTSSTLIPSGQSGSTTAYTSASSTNAQSGNFLVSSNNAASLGGATDFSKDQLGINATAPTGCGEKCASADVGSSDDGGSTDTGGTDTGGTKDEPTKDEGGSDIGSSDGGDGGTTDGGGTKDGGTKDGGTKDGGSTDGDSPVTLDKGAEETPDSTDGGESGGATALETADGGTASK